jgi:hypothetical protein
MQIIKGTFHKLIKSFPTKFLQHYLTFLCSNFFTQERRVYVYKINMDTGSSSETATSFLDADRLMEQECESAATASAM